MSDARSNRIISAVTLTAFIVNTFAYDLAWATPTAPDVIARSPAASSGATKQSKEDFAAPTFSLPEYLGTIRDSWQSSRRTKDEGRGTMIIHIQDAHCNYAAQKRIAEIIEYLDREYGIGTINLEGGAKDYDLSIFTNINDKIIREKVADYFVKEGLVNAAEYYAINNPDRIKLWGIEDASLYVDNLKIYRNSLKHKDEVKRSLKSLSHIISNLKRHIWQKELLELDMKYTQYKAGNLEFKEYLNYLMSAAKGRLIDIKQFSNIFLLSQTLGQEGDIDFRKANNERDLLIDTLQRKMSKTSMEELVVKTVEFRSERISQAAFYTYLALKAKGLGVDLAEFPQVQKYVIYLSTYGAIDKVKIMSEIEALEGRIKETLYQSDRDRELDLLSKNLAITKNVFAISMTREDYRYYRDNEDSFHVKRFVKFIKKEAPTYNITATLDDNIDDLDRHREEMARFYEYSFKRDKAFIKNVKLRDSLPVNRLTGPPVQNRPTDQPDNRITILITGGFHTENLCETFKERNISYISIMPNFKNDPSLECPYSKLLGGIKSAEDIKIAKIFSSHTMAIASILNQLGEAAMGREEYIVRRIKLHLAIARARGDRGIEVINGTDRRYFDLKLDELPSAEGSFERVSLPELAGLLLPSPSTAATKEPPSVIASPVPVAASPLRYRAQQSKVEPPLSAVERAREVIDSIRPDFGDKAELTGHEFREQMERKAPESKVEVVDVGILGVIRENFHNAMNSFKERSAADFLVDIFCSIALVMIPRVDWEGEKVRMSMIGRTAFVAPLIIFLILEFIGMAVDFPGRIWLSLIYSGMFLTNIVIYLLHESSFRHELKHVYIHTILNRLYEERIIKLTAWEVNRLGLLGVDEGLLVNLRERITPEILHTIEQNIIDNVVKKYGVGTADLTSEQDPPAPQQPPGTGSGNIAPAAVGLSVFSLGLMTGSAILALLGIALTAGFFAWLIYEIYAARKLLAILKLAEEKPDKVTSSGTGEERPERSIAIQLLEKLRTAQSADEELRIESEISLAAASLGPYIADRIFNPFVFVKVYVDAIKEEDRANNTPGLRVALRALTACRTYPSMVDDLYKALSEAGVTVEALIDIEKDRKDPNKNIGAIFAEIESSRTASLIHAEERAKKMMASIRPDFGGKEELAAQEFKDEIEKKAPESKVEIVDVGIIEIVRRNLHKVKAALEKRSITSLWSAIVYLALLFNVQEFEVKEGRDKATIRCNSKFVFIPLSMVCVALPFLGVAVGYPRYILIFLGLLPIYLIGLGLSVEDLLTRDFSLRHELKHLYIYTILNRLYAEKIINISYLDINYLGLLGPDDGLPRVAVRKEKVTPEILQAIEQNIIDNVVKKYGVGTADLSSEQGPPAPHQLPGTGSGNIAPAAVGLSVFSLGYFTGSAILVLLGIVLTAGFAWYIYRMYASKKPPVIVPPVATPPAESTTQLPQVTTPMPMTTSAGVAPERPSPKDGLCVTADTLLTLENGERIPIVEIKPGEYVLSLNEVTKRTEPHRVVGLLNMGIKPVYKLTTVSGRSIKTTANHPYLTHGGWVKVGGLKAGDEIAVPMGGPIGGADASFSTDRNQIESLPQRRLPEGSKALQLPYPSYSSPLSGQTINPNAKNAANTTTAETRNDFEKSAKNLLANPAATMMRIIFLNVLATHALRPFVNIIFIPDGRLSQIAHSVNIYDNDDRFVRVVYAEELAPSAVFWDAIASIEYIGLRHVYDIEVEGTHNFIGNDIFAHNTYIQQPQLPRGPPGAALPVKAAPEGPSPRAPKVLDIELDRAADGILEEIDRSRFAYRTNDENRLKGIQRLIDSNDPENTVIAAICSTVISNIGRVGSKRDLSWLNDPANRLSVLERVAEKLKQRIDANHADLPVMHSTIAFQERPALRFFSALIHEPGHAMTYGLRHPMWSLTHPYTLLITTIKAVWNAEFVFPITGPDGKPVPETGRWGAVIAYAGPAAALTILSLIPIVIGGIVGHLGANLLSMLMVDAITILILVPFVLQELKNFDINVPGSAAYNAWLAVQPPVVSPVRVATPPLQETFYDAAEEIRRGGVLAKGDRIISSRGQTERTVEEISADGRYFRYAVTMRNGIKCYELEPKKANMKEFVDRILERGATVLRPSKREDDSDVRREVRGLLAGGIELRAYAEGNEEGGQVDYRRLAEMGLAPAHKIQLFQNETYYLSEPFIAEGGRIGFVAYFLHKPNNGKRPKLFVNGYCTSNSHGAWRAISHIGEGPMEGWFGKGFGQDSQALPLEICEELMRIASSRAGLKRRERIFEKVLGRGSIIPDGTQLGTQFAQMQIDTERLVVAEEVPLEGRHAGIYQTHIFKFDKGLKPDFEKGVSRPWLSENPLYGVITHYRVRSVDGRIQYLFNADKRGRMWIGSIQMTSGALDRQGVRADRLTIALPQILMTTPWQYNDEMPKGYTGHPHPDPVHGRHYSDASAFLDKIDIVKEAKKMLPKAAPRAPPTLPGKGIITSSSAGLFIYLLGRATDYIPLTFLGLAATAGFLAWYVYRMYISTTPPTITPPAESAKPPAAGENELEGRIAIHLLGKLRRAWGTGQQSRIDDQISLVVANQGLYRRADLNPRIFIRTYIEEIKKADSSSDILGLRIALDALAASLSRLSSRTFGVEAYEHVPEVEEAARLLLDLAEDPKKDIDLSLAASMAEIAASPFMWLIPIFVKRIESLQKKEETAVDTVDAARYRNLSEEIKAAMIRRAMAPFSNVDFRSLFVSARFPSNYFKKHGNLKFKTMLYLGTAASRENRWLVRKRPVSSIRARIMVLLWKDVVSARRKAQRDFYDNAKIMSSRDAHMLWINTEQSLIVRYNNIIEMLLEGGRCRNIGTLGSFLFGENDDARLWSARMLYWLSLSGNEVAARALDAAPEMKQVAEREWQKQNEGLNRELRIPITKLPIINRPTSPTTPPVAPLGSGRLDAILSDLHMQPELKGADEAELQKLAQRILEAQLAANGAAISKVTNLDGINLPGLTQISPAALGQMGLGGVGEDGISTEGPGLTKKDFITLDQFICAQNKLAERTLGEEVLNAVLKALDLNTALQQDIAYQSIYEQLAKRGYTAGIIALINQGTYDDPRINIEIEHQNKAPRLQGVLEAVSNGLDAHGYRIGQFGKGIKQILDWLEESDTDRVTVFTRNRDSAAYQLTIFKDTGGQLNINIREIPLKQFQNYGRRYGGGALEQGTIVRVAAATAIPRKESGQRNSQETIVKEIHRRFAFVTDVDIFTQERSEIPKHVNGFETKTVIVPAGGEFRHGPKDIEGRFVRAQVDDHAINIVDNGCGMNAEVLARMFVPKEGTKGERQIGGPAQVLEELGKIKVVHDADRSLPQRVYFSRNGECVLTVDTQPRKGEKRLVPSAIVEGGLMLELGLLLDVPESRDMPVMQANLKPGEKAHVQIAVEHAVKQILEHTGLSDEEKLRYINTITVGLDGLINENANYEHLISVIRASLQEMISPAIEGLRKRGVIILPHAADFAKLEIPQDRKVLYLHEKLFPSRITVESLAEIGGQRLSGITYGGNKYLPIWIAPFTKETTRYARAFAKDWYGLTRAERLPVIVAEGLAVIPQGAGGRRLLDLTHRRQRLTDEEKREFNSLLQMVNIFTAQIVNVSYEFGKTERNLEAEPLDFEKSRGEIDSDAVNKFLIHPPAALEAARSGPRQSSAIPEDAQQALAISATGEVMEIGSGLKFNVGFTAKKIEAISHGYYLIEGVTTSLAGTGDVWWVVLCRLVQEPTGGATLEKIQTSYPGGLVISPDKNFVLIKRTDEWNIKEIMDCRSGKIYYHFGLAEQMNIQTEEYSQPQFSPDGRYLVYLAKCKIPGIRGQDLCIVDLQNPHDALKRFTYIAERAEFTIGPFAKHAVFLRNKADGLMHCVDLESGKWVIYNARMLHTDSTGAFTFILRNNNQVSIYVHQAQKLIASTDLVGGAINSFTIYYHPDGTVTGNIFTNGAEYDLYPNGGLLLRLGLSEDGLFPGLPFICRETIDVPGETIKFSMPGHDPIQERWGDLDPLQRLERETVYRHPHHDLIIDNTDPQRPAAIDPKSGNIFHFMGEISQVRYDEGGRVAEILSHEYDVVYVTHEDPLTPGVFDARRAGEAKFVCRDEAGGRFLLKSRLSIHGEFYLLGDAETNLISPVVALTQINPDKYDHAFSDGVYFIFLDRDTGDAVYLDPADVDRPIFVNAAFRQIQDKEEPSAVRLWQEQVFARRQQFIDQARSAFMPFFELVPEEFQAGLENDFETTIAELYANQEKAVNERFQDTPQEGRRDVDFTNLPFDIFSQRTQQLLALLPGFLKKYAAEVAQERLAVRNRFYHNLFHGLFVLAGRTDLTAAAIDEDLLTAFSWGWVVLREDGLAASKDINAFVHAMQDASYGATKREAITTLMTILGNAVISGTRQRAAVVTGQMAKILRLRPQAKDKYLRQMHQSFEQALREHPDLSEGASTKLPPEVTPFIIFLSNEVEQVAEKERAEPQGRDRYMASDLEGDGIGLSQIMKLEQARPKRDEDDLVMDMDYLLSKLDHLPGISDRSEAALLRDVTLQRESGAYTAEIAQNSRDATRGANGELVVSFYIEDGPTGKKEYVEEAQDNGTGALREAALLLAKSTKAAAGQVDLAGFFGTGKYTIFEGVDRFEIITKNDQRAYLFGFRVSKDESGNPKAIRLMQIREIDDAGIGRGVTVRRIKASDSTIPELDQMLARRAWSNFCGLSQDEHFRIFFLDHEGHRQPLMVRRQVLSETEFVPGKRSAVDKPTMRIIAANDVPQQLIDRAGFRISEIPREAERDYLALVPASLQQLIQQLGIVIQVPLPLIRNRSAVFHEDRLRLDIQKYIAIEFYKAIAFKALTQTNPQFVFENFPVDWETNDDYWHSINPAQDKEVVALASKINSGRYGDIGEQDLDSLVTEAGKLDIAKRFMKLILLLDAPLDTAKPERKTSLYARRQAIQERVNPERAEEQKSMLAAAKYESSAKADFDEIPFAKEKLVLAEQMAADRRDRDSVIEPSTPEEFALIAFAQEICRHFNVEQILLVRETVSFNGAFGIRRGKRTMFLNHSLAGRIGQPEISTGKQCQATDTVSHELAHLFEELMREDAAHRLWEKGFSSPSNLTHEAIGPFAEGMKYAAMISFLNHEQGRRPEVDEREFTGIPGQGGTGSAKGKDEADLGLCLTPDSLIYQPGGSAKPLIQIKPGDEVLSLNEKTQRLEPHKVVALLDMGVKPVYRIRTQSGKELKTTLNHPYLTKEGWKRLEEIKAGEKIAVAELRTGPSHLLNSSFNNGSGNKEAAFSGEHDQCLFTSFKRNPAFMKGVSNNAHSPVYFYHEVLTSISGWQIVGEDDAWAQATGKIKYVFFPCMQPEFFTDSFNFRDGLFFNRLDFKVFPTANFLNRDFFPEADFSQDTGRSVYGREFFQQGDFTNLVQVNKWAGINDASCCHYVPTLHLAGQSSLVVQPDAPIPGQQAVLSLSARYASLDIAPIRHLPTFFLSQSLLPQQLPAPAFPGAIQLFPAISQLWFPASGPPFLRKDNTTIRSSQADSDVIYDAIASIEYIGDQQVYDIEVEGTHNFLAQGIVAHNTYAGLAGQASDVPWEAAPDEMAGLAPEQGQAPSSGATAVDNTAEGGQAPSSPFRFPDYIWQEFKTNLQSRLGDDVYDTVKLNGLAWTDLAGNIHYIDEKLTSSQAQEVWEYAKQAIEVSTGKTIESADKVKEVVAYHESLHAKFRDRKYKELIKSFRQKLKEIYPGIPLNEDHPFIASFRNAYGKPHGEEAISGQDPIDWYTEEFLVLSAQEAISFKDSQAVIRRMGIGEDAAHGQIALIVKDFIRSMTKEQAEQRAMLSLLMRMSAETYLDKNMPDLANILIKLIELREVTYDSVKATIDDAVRRCFDKGWPDSAANILIKLIELRELTYDKVKATIDDAVRRCINDRPHLASNILAACMKQLDRDILRTAETEDIFKEAEEGTRELLEVMARLRRIYGGSIDSVVIFLLMRGVSIAEINLCLGGAGTEMARSLLNLVLSKCETSDAATRKDVFDNIIQKLFFKDPGLFDLALLNKLKSIFSRDVPTVKYLLFFAGRKSPDLKLYDSKLFPHQEGFKRLIGHGRKRVLVMHNIKDGQGDELVRNGTLIQALLDFNHEIEVIIYTGREYLYTHPRVVAKNIGDYKPDDAGSFDLIIHHYDTSQRYSDDAKNSFQRYLSSHRPSVYIKTDKSSDEFTYKKILVGSNEIPSPSFDGNVYTAPYRLCAELGLDALRMGTEKPPQSLFTGLPNDEAKSYWEREVVSYNKENRPILVFNGFGGESENKGYDRSDAGKVRFAKDIHEAIEAGYFVAVLPNHREWGTPEVVKSVVDRLSKKDKEYVGHEIPPPQANQLLHKYFLEYSDMVCTVEGGLMHLAYNMGKPFRVISMAGSGSLEKWMPVTASLRQGLVGADIGEGIRSFGITDIERGRPLSDATAPATPADKQIREGGGMLWGDLANLVPDRTDWQKDEIIAIANEIISKKKATTLASAAAMSAPAVADTPEARMAATVKALGAVEGEGKTGIVKIVVGVPAGAEFDSVCDEASLNNISRGLSDNGYGIIKTDPNYGSRIPDKRQIFRFAIDPSDPGATLERYRNAVTDAKAQIAKDMKAGAKAGYVVAFAPQMVTDLKLIDEYKTEQNIIVAPDRYTDCNPETKQIPNMCGRNALARAMVRCRQVEAGNVAKDMESAINAVKSFLADIADNDLTDADIKDLNMLLEKLYEQKGLMIKPVDYEGNTRRWRTMEIATATSA